MADYSNIQTSGGQKTGTIAAGAGAADEVVSTSPGRINRLVVTTSATTASLEIYDSATTSAAGTLIWKSPTTFDVGTIKVLDLPVSVGIVAKKVLNSAACTVIYTEDAVSGSGPDKAHMISEGGQGLSHHAAGATGAKAALAAPGRLCKVSVLSSGSAATIIYDNASAASGTKLFTVPASPTIGDVFDIQVPAANGIYVGGATNTSQLLVTYLTEDAYGR